MIQLRKDLVKTIFITAALLFMAVYVWRTIQLVEYFPSSPDIAVLFTSILINWFGFISVLMIWKFLLHSYGEKITFIQAYRIYFRSNLGKYLPGKVWQLAGMVYLTKEIGIAPKKSIPASLYNQGVAVITGLAIFLVTVPVNTTGITNTYVWLTILIVAIFLFIVSPDFLTGILNRALRMLGKDEIRGSIGRGTLLVTFISYIVAWCIFGWGFHLFLRFLGDANELTLSRAVGIFSGSVSIGFLAFFSPGGIGVREGVMVFFMEKYYPLTTALFISITARLWITAVELVGFLSTLLLSVKTSTGSSSA